MGGVAGILTAMPWMSSSLIRRGMIRYSSGNGANVNDAGDFDRVKFTHEVKIEMPDVGDDIDCE